MINFNIYKQRKLKYNGGYFELHLLLDRCVGQRARGTTTDDTFLYLYENRLNNSLGLVGGTGEPRELVSGGTELVRKL